MTWVARELPRGSGRWTCVNEPDRPHAREAPQFECSLCERVIGKKRSVVLLKDQRVVCIGCVNRRGLAANGIIDCFGTRAGIAIRLGIWPGKPDAAKVSFRQWLKQFTASRDAIGDLARDVYADRRWPRGPGSLARYETYLLDAGVSPEVIATLQAAWGFERERGK
jgi:YozE SAM-like fold